MGLWAAISAAGMRQTRTSTRRCRWPRRQPPGFSARRVRIIGGAETDHLRDGLHDPCLRQVDPLCRAGRAGRSFPAIDRLLVHAELVGAPTDQQIAFSQELGGAVFCKVEAH